MQAIAALTVADYAELYGISERAVRKKIQGGKLRAEAAYGKGGNSGIQYRIPTEALDERHKLKYIKKVCPAPERPGITTAPPITRDDPLGAASFLETAEAVDGTGIRFEQLSEAKRADALRWETVLREWHIARHEYRGDRGRFDTDFARRLETTVATLYRKDRQYKAGGLCGLADLRGVANEGRTKIDRELWSVYEGFFLDENQRQMQTCYDLTAIWTTAKRPDLLPIPSPRTFERRAAKIPEAFVQLYRYGNKSYLDNAQPYIMRLYDDIESNDIWVADNHTLDVISRQEGTEVRHRLYLTMYIDVRSRLPMAHMICTTPNSDANLAALRDGIRRHGIPKMIYVDNGREFLTTDFGGRGHRRAAKEPLPPTILSHLGIKMINALPRNAKAKIIERVFREFCEDFSKLFESYIGSNPKDRPERSKHTARAADMICDGEIIEAIDKYINGYYAHKPQSGTGMNGKAPLEVYRANLTEKRVATEDELNLMMLRTSRYQTVGRNGVKLTLYGESLWYSDYDFLLEWQGKKVYVRYDPQALDSVRVYDEQDRYIATLPARSELVQSYFATADELKEGLHYVRGYTKHVKAAYKAGLVEVPERMSALEVVMAAAENNLMAARDDGDYILTPVRHIEESAAAAKASGDDLQRDIISRMARSVIKKK